MHTDNPEPSPTDKTTKSKLHIFDLLLVPIKKIGHSAVVVKLRHASRRIQLMIGAVISLLVLLVAVLIFLLLQNSKAASLFKSAQVSVGKEQYSTALSSLQKASTYYSFPANHKRITQLTSEDRVWVAEANDLQQAKTLYQKLCSIP